MAITEGTPVAQMLKVDAARAIIVDAVEPVSAEDVAIAQCAGRILAENIKATRAVPAFDNSAMDGIGVRGVDVIAAHIPAELRVVGESLPGADVSKLEVRAREACRIMTGGRIPPGVDTVIMRERTDEARIGEGFVTVLEAAPLGQHIRRRGEDVEVDDVVGRAGDVVSPAALNLLASAGVVRVRARKRPVVAILASGDELKELGQPLAEGDVPNSNAHAVAAAVRALGCDTVLLGIAPDNLPGHIAAVRRALDVDDLGRAADALVTIGGVSMGTHDFVRPALEAIGARLDMWKVAMRPGKPIAFGRVPVDATASSTSGRPATMLFFGLPGNPVSALVSTELFLRPALEKLRGAATLMRPLWKATLVDAPFIKKSGLEHWARGVARLDPVSGMLRVKLHEGQGSHQISALARANALVRFGVDVERVDAGSSVELMLLADPLTAGPL